jgi:S1-C subfamily serine protease
MFKLSSLLAALLMVLTTQVYAGMVTLPDGSIYVGELQGSVPNGFGTVYVDDAEAYTGDWLLGKKSGFGREVTDEDTYLGGFLDGVRHGFGTKTAVLNDGASFVTFGNFHQGKMNGFGRFESVKNNVLVVSWTGNWTNGCMNGLGKHKNSKHESQFWNIYDMCKARESLLTRLVGVHPSAKKKNNWLQQSKALTEKEILLNEKPELIALTRQSEPSSSTQFNASGSGFFVNQSGYVLTNNHVIEGCSKIDLRLSGKELVEAKLISSDRLNDLALLKTAAQSSFALPLETNNAALLADIYAAGFPFGDSVNSTIKITRGVVSSLSGFGDNFSQFQIDAAIQPGNSGGPIINKYGNAVGVVVSKLQLDAEAASRGVVPENTNFGIKAAIAKSFLSGNGIATEDPNMDVLEATELAKILSQATVYVMASGCSR